MISVLRLHLPVCIKENSFLTKKENLLARIPKLAISLSCLSRFLSGTLGQSRRQEIWASPLPSAKNSPILPDHLLQNGKGEVKTRSWKLIRPSRSARFHLLTIMHAIHDSHMFHHKVLRSPALRRARLWFWNICPLFSRQEPWKYNRDGQRRFLCMIGDATPLDTHSNQKWKRYECRARPPRSNRNSSHPWSATTQCPVWERLFLTDGPLNSTRISGFFYHVVVSTDNLDFRLWSVFLRNKNIPFYFKYDRFRKKSFSHIKKWAWHVLSDSFF